MKFQHENPEFRPITITLEAQAEVDALHALTALACGGYADQFTYKLYIALHQHSNSKPSDYWNGSLTAKR